MELFLIAGKARSGKDSIANIIKEKLVQKNKKVCIIRYSSYLKYYIREYFGWDGKEESKEQYRSLMNKIGTEIIREKIDKNFFIKRIIEDIKVLSNFFDYAIISDVREPNEIIAPKEIFSVIAINVSRPNYISDLTEQEQKHFTETALDDFNDYDYKIVNNGTLEDLKIKVIDILEKED